MANRTESLIAQRRRAELELDSVTARVRLAAADFADLSRLLRMQDWLIPSAHPHGPALRSLFSLSPSAAHLCSPIPLAPLRIEVVAPALTGRLIDLLA